MADPILTMSDLEFAAITFNAVLLLSMAFAIFFSEKINDLVAKFIDGSKGFLFSPPNGIDLST